MGKTEITTSHLEEEKGVPEEMADQVIQVKLSELHPFEGHPFKVLDDETMENTVESIKQIGIAVPLLVRPDPFRRFVTLPCMTNWNWIRWEIRNQRCS